MEYKVDLLAIVLAGVCVFPTNVSYANPNYESISFPTSQSEAASNSDNKDLAHDARRAVRVAVARGRALRSPAAKGTNFSGRWGGRYTLIENSCPGAVPSFRFRHLIAMAGNRVRIDTSHDGTLFGTSRDKGRRLETGRSYIHQGGLNVIAAVVYGNLRGSSATTILVADLSTNDFRCRVFYGGTSFRG